MTGRAGTTPPAPPSQVLVLRFSAAPKGPKQESPGGGNPACGVGPGDPIRMKIHPALKGRNKILDHLTTNCSAPSGRCYSQHRIQFPGQCPGLVCRCPFGARFKKRNIKSFLAGPRVVIPLRIEAGEIRSCALGEPALEIARDRFRTASSQRLASLVGSSSSRRIDSAAFPCLPARYPTNISSFVVIGSATPPVEARGRLPTRPPTPARGTSYYPGKKVPHAAAY